MALDATRRWRGPTAGSFVAAAQGAVRFDASAIRPLAALRATAGLIAVLAVAIGAYGPAVGAAAGVGALLPGMVSVSGTNRRPLATMLATTAGVSLSAFVGSVVGSPWGFHVAVLAVWTFAAGMFVAVGPGAAGVGTQATMAFIVFGHYHEPAREAAKLAGDIAAGGGAELLLVAVTRWTGAIERQRRAVAAAYRRLADLADGGIAASSLGAGDAFDAAALSLSSPSLFRRAELAPLRTLVEEGRRVRVELAALTGLRGQLVRLDTAGAGRLRTPPPPGEAVTEVARFLRGVADTLSPRHSGVPIDLDAATERLDAVLRDAAPEPPTGPDRDQLQPADVIRLSIVDHLAALAGQLRAIAAMARRVNATRSRVTLVAGDRLETSDLAGRLRAQLDVVRANLTAGSTTFRHAVRLAGVVVVAEAVGQAVPLQRGYWVPLTAVIILRPDFSSTWTRGVARLAGTLVGAGLIGLLTETLHPRGTSAVVALGAMAFAAYLTFPASYACFSVFITGLVVLLVDLVTPGTLSTTADRVVDTLIGGVIAMAAYTLWPSWSDADARHALGDLIEATRDYVAAVLAAAASEEALALLARRMRLARSNAEAAVERALGEPVTVGRQLAWGSGVLDGQRRISQVAHALRVSRPSVLGATDDLTAFAAAVTAALDQIAGSARSGLPTGDLPPLRRLHSEVAEAAAERPDGPFLAVETDELVDAIDTVAGLFDRTPAGAG